MSAPRYGCWKYKAAKSIYLLIYVYIYTGCRETRDTFIESSPNVETTRTALLGDDFILQPRVKEFERFLRMCCAYREKYTLRYDCRDCEG